MKRLVTLAIFFPPLCGCMDDNASYAPDVADLELQLANAERAWLDAYDNNDRSTMSATLATGFTITFPDGRIDTRDDVIAGLDPSDEPDEDPTHYTEERKIRIIGDTAILSGIYVDPGDAGEPEDKSRYTDTWMLIDGQWRVVASHLSDFKEGEVK
ncbi:MAG: nuclear transport factor 2 family protein [Pseudomonadota bacterium]